LKIITISIPQSTPNIQIHPLQNNIHVSNVHCGSAFKPGASGLPYYYTPPVCVHTVLLALTVWWQNNFFWSAICTWFVPLPECNHSQGVYFPPNRRQSIIFRVLIQQINKQSKSKGTHNHELINIIFMDLLISIFNLNTFCDTFNIWTNKYINTVTCNKNDYSSCTLPRVFFMRSPSFLMCILFYFLFIWIHVYAFASNSMVHCGSAFEPSRLPYYCISICVRSCCTWRARCVDSKPKKINLIAQFWCGKMANTHTHTYTHTHTQKHT